MRRTTYAILLGAALTASACTSGDEAADPTAAPTTEASAPDTTVAAPDTTVGATTPPSEAPVVTEPVVTEPIITEPEVVYPDAEGPAPGVTDTAVKIGVTYVDTEALKAVGLDYDLGDFEATFSAIATIINDGGGIHGRQIELVFAPVDPTNPASAEEVCVKLTEDDDVFMGTGYFRGESALCLLDVHETAVIGGQMNSSMLAAAKAPWLSPDADTELTKTIVASLVERGALDGKVGVFTHVSDAGGYETDIAPILADMGINPVEIGIIDAPTDDTAALRDAVKLTAEKFKSSGVDTVLAVGGTGAQWLVNMEDDTEYRPNLVFTASNAPLSFATSAATTDLSILEGALVGGAFGPDSERFAEAEMQGCVEAIRAEGVEVLEPVVGADDPSQQPYYAAIQACQTMTLAWAALDAAGPKLNYATLALAIEAGIEVPLPGDPTVRTYGPGTAGDGDPAGYVYQWDTATNQAVLLED